MAKIIGIDLGTATIGVATSDPLEIIASPWKTIRYNHNNQQVAATLITNLAQKLATSVIVYGLPLNMDGSKSKTTKYIEAIIKLIKATTSNLTLIPIDERWTSKQATNIAIAGGFKKRQRKKLNDQIAAALILQTYLHQKR